MIRIALLTCLFSLAMEGGISAQQRKSDAPIDLHQEMKEMQRRMLEGFYGNFWGEPFSFSFPEFSDSLLMSGGGEMDTVIQLPGGGTIHFKSFGNGFSQHFDLGPGRRFPQDPIEGSGQGDSSSEEELPEEKLRREKNNGIPGKSAKPKLNTIKI